MSGWPDDDWCARNRLFQANKYRQTWRKQIGKRLRFLVFEKKGHTCVYCGSDFAFTLDHLWPASLGGQNSFGNLVPCCQWCNTSKGNKTLNDWVPPKRRISA